MIEPTELLTRGVTYTHAHTQNIIYIYIYNTIYLTRLYETRKKWQALALVYVPRLLPCGIKSLRGNVPYVNTSLVTR